MWGLGIQFCLDAAGRVRHGADLLTRRYHAVHFRRRLLNAQSWRNAITGRNAPVQWLFGALRGRAMRSPAAETEDAGFRQRMSRQELSEVAGSPAVRVAL